MLGAQCLSCKKRRVRCDSAKPTCARCPKDGIECPGYEKPTVWINHTQSSTSIKRSRHRPAEGAQRLAKALCAVGKQSKAPSKKLVPKSFHLLNEQKWFPADEATMRIMDSVIYYNDCIAPFIVPDPAVVNWSMIPLDEWRCEPQLIKDIMLMIVSQHKAIRGQRDLDRDLEVCQQRNNTIQALNKQLSNVSTQITDVALDAVMMLLTADGAAAIIELRGGWHKYLQSSCENQYSASYFLSIEVMGGTTSNAQLLSQSINWPRGLAEDFPDWDAIAVTACFPCPATLFHAISRINDLRASLFRQTSSSALTTTFSSLSLQSPHEDTIDEIRSILKQIKAFSASKWLPAVIKTLDFEFEPTSPDWLALTHCYHTATLLYCLRTLVFESPLRHHDEFDEALSSLLEDLFGTSVGEALSVERGHVAAVHFRV
ncbi:hypothetical protein SLS56_009527 [Neofusicoccum ribis]|uniref:Zn(2)-C6 fungal-type domain-containing protein n=1 Tax=Neofusicoccum ribis TaxID=45134 RepID=A0ABR3SHI9_9PEZI